MPSLKPCHTANRCAAARSTRARHWAAVISSLSSLVKTSAMNAPCAAARYDLRLWQFPCRRNGANCRLAMHVDHGAAAELPAENTRREPSDLRQRDLLDHP